MPTTLVTGATGFLAGHCVDQLLKKGHTVVGTVRNPQKTEQLSKAFQDQIDKGKLKLETLKDVRDQDGYKQIFEKYPEMTYILHTASPFNFNAQDPVKDMLEPAVEGTLACLKSTKSYAPNVKKVVITSSIAANMDINTYFDDKSTLTEESWNPISWEEASEKGEVFKNYVGSKLFAEKAGLEFLNNENPHFSISWINPSYIFGPGMILDPSALNTSNEAIVSNALETKKGEDTPHISGWFVDVRDCAKAHILALDPSLDGKRLILATSKFCTQDLLEIANKIPQLQGKIAVPNPDEKPSELKKVSNIDSSESKRLLNTDWIGLEKSVLDFSDQWLKSKQ